ncbi:uncharacterized protein [Halyomorpha halys]|uniref:uncharacterized protein isoform X2 n=1 Tax=Halyomorpha halys TaxID=286706 RepID=UPI0006D51F80|nr:uncharacterized protein LOC106685423 isoform X2 [Halyomorpha halys]
MDMKTEIYNQILLDMVSAYQGILFGNRAVKQKQEVWKEIHAELVSRGLIDSDRDWKGIRQQWYRLSNLARRSREQYLLGRIYDIPEFDKKLLRISGIPVIIDEEQTNYAVERLNMENQREVNSTTKDNMEIIEHKVVPMDDVKSKEIMDQIEIDYLSRKVNEQRFKLQQCKLLKRKCEIYNIKNKNEREEFMRLL